ncbi:hypothetical protein [Gordonia phage GTE5]|uniref:Uncharacterized protein n=1 Tax=Gordonia phage GTE5 TaxID=319522 RepID=Q2TLU2_9CAUD|nr:virion structural protein [Gordonia phage GTE5]AAY16503.1 hypothetical protein GTE5p016 [Gordonia phage GTE5]AET09775.1 hypothetical protein [Gordonia phage GTE5]
MSFNAVKLVHPKTGVVVTATTAVDLTNFRFNDGYVPVDTAKVLVGSEDGERKYPKLAEGLKVVEEMEAAGTADTTEAKGDDTKSADTEVASTQSKTGRTAKGSTTAKSGTDATGQQVGVN